MEEVEMCKNAAAAALKSGIDRSQLQGILEVQHFSPEAISQTLQKYNLIYMTPEDKQFTAQPVSHKEKLYLSLTDIMFEHYMIFTIVSALLLLAVLAVVNMNIFLAVVPYIVVRIPQAFIFSSILEVVIIVGELEKKVKWGGAFLLGMALSAIPLTTPSTTFGWWIEIPIVLICVLPLVLFYELEFGESIFIAIFWVILSIMYHVYLLPLVGF